MSRSDRDDEYEWQIVWRRRIFFIVLAVVVLGGCVWFVHWLSNGIGMNKIGDHYKQAEEY